jgi:hypothetical protein
MSSTPNRNIEIDQHVIQSLANIVDKYVHRRDERLQEVFRILDEDRAESLPIKLLFQNDPELKKKTIPADLASLSDVLRDVFFKPPNSAEG